MGALLAPGLLHDPTISQRYSASSQGEPLQPLSEGRVGPSPPLAGPSLSLQLRLPLPSRWQLSLPPSFSLQATHSLLPLTMWKGHVWVVVTCGRKVCISSDPSEVCEADCPRTTACSSGLAALVVPKDSSSLCLVAEAHAVRLSSCWLWLVVRPPQS